VGEGSLPQADTSRRVAARWAQDVRETFMERRNLDGFLSSFEGHLQLEWGVPIVPSSRSWCGRVGRLSQCVAQRMASEM
jgi:hypothetical protein